MVRTRRTSSRTDCPICMEGAKHAVETNCGHIYCGKCILLVHTVRSQQLSPIVCPYCRQDVTLLLSCFTDNEENSASQEEEVERERITNQIQEYNRIYGNHPRTIWGQLRDLPTILRHVWAEFFTWRGLEFFYRMRIVLCFLAAITYAVIPFDLIPEGLLGLLGLLDDIIIVIFLLIQVGTFYRNHLSNS